MSRVLLQLDLTIIIFFMSFQAYLDTIQTKTGKSPSDYKELAEQKGFLMNGELAEGVKATQIVDWLKKEYDLGHGHAMALFALFKGIKKEGDK